MRDDENGAEMTAGERRAGSGTATGKGGGEGIAIEGSHHLDVGVARVSLLLEGVDHGHKTILERSALAARVCLVLH